MLSPHGPRYYSSRRKASSHLLPDLYSLSQPEPCSTEAVWLYHHRLKKVTTKLQNTPVLFSSFLDISFFGEPQVINKVVAAPRR